MVYAYQSATTTITIGGFFGRSFPLGHSMHQGCPLALYLFLFFAEALSASLCTQSTPIQGIHLPLPARAQAELLGLEYVDDIY